MRFDGRCYQTLDWSLGGFSVVDYVGARRPGQQFFVELSGQVNSEVLHTLITAAVVRLDSQAGFLAAEFVHFHGGSFDKLEQIATQRLRKMA